MKNVLLPMLLCLSIPVFGQIKIDSFFTLTGSADTYFRYNLNSTNDATNGGSLAPVTSFANLPGFAMGMFNLIAKYEKGKTGFVTDLVFGPRGRDAVFNSPGSLNIVNQAYAFYKPTDKLTLTMGKFNTFVGYEVISPVLNYHYSTSYMFSFGPFNHTGLKGNYDLGKGFGVMAGVFNPTDYTDSNPNNTYYFGGQLSYVFDQGSVYLNTLLNKDYKQFDLTSSFKVSNTMNLGLNATTASDFFSGIALYTNLTMTESFSAGIRAEYFKDNGIGILDSDAEPATTSNHVFDITLSGNITLGQLRIIPEYRIDMYSDNLVLPDATSLLRKDNLSSLLVAAVYSF
ncbi:MAG: porin [Saprospiraceae bacterium]|nr:porin [Saprospiraceae bacterium]